MMKENKTALYYLLHHIYDETNSYSMQTIKIEDNISISAILGRDDNK